MLTKLNAFRCAIPAGNHYPWKWRVHYTMNPGPRRFLACVHLYRCYNRDIKPRNENTADGTRPPRPPGCGGAEWTKLRRLMMICCQSGVTPCRSTISANQGRFPRRSGAACVTWDLPMVFPERGRSSVPEADTCKSGLMVTNGLEPITRRGSWSTYERHVATHCGRAALRPRPRRSDCRGNTRLDINLFRG